MAALTAAQWIAVGSTAVSAWGAKKASQQAKANMAMAQQQSAEARAWQKEQQAKLDAQKEVYKNFTFENPYANMENVYEDLTVSQKAIEFGKQQIQQQQANIIGGFRDIAGASGIAALAQTLANQGAIQAQKIAVVTGQEEMAAQQLRAGGAAAIQTAERGGRAVVQEAEMGRQATLLGVEYGGATGANLAVQQAMQNQLNAQIEGQKMMNKARENMLKSLSGAADLKWSNIYDPSKGGWQQG